MSVSHRSVFFVPNERARYVYRRTSPAVSVPAAASTSASSAQAPAADAPELELHFALPPSGAPQLRPLLFVHGSFHSAFCWEENFLPYFASLGHPSFAVSLRGHGGSPTTGIEDRAPVVKDYIEDIHWAFDEIERRAPNAGEPVIVAHSIGGLVLANYIEQYQPERAVFMCSMPPSGIVNIAKRTLLRNPFEVWEFVQAFGMKKALKDVKLCRRAFFSEGVPDTEVEKHMRRLKAPPRTLSLGKISLPDRSKLPGKTRALVLGARNDFVVDVPAVHETAEAFGVDATVFEDAAHDLMLEPRWRDAADVIAAWLRS
eukprot:tig00000632_g2743.t1